MDESRWLRWSAACGLAAVACGVAAIAFERPWPSAGDSAAFPAFAAEHRGAILAQSMLFIVSAGLYLCFLGGLRSFLLRGVGGNGGVTTLAFGAGVVWCGLNVVALAPQITLALPTQAGHQASWGGMLSDLGFVMLGTANLPASVLFAAVALVSLRTRVFPTWLGWLAVLAAVGAFTLTFTVVSAGGPLAPQGWLTYVLYLTPIGWLVPAAVVMFRRADAPPRRSDGYVRRRRNEARAA
jgi:hypothetical protein